ncbi:MAG: RNA helicase [Gammaproteobacteria bacterium]|nr:MAG: RNA helicase [Gammaproteobacteria bacterium]RLA24138.1 MAG: RNA helicase [Gammaproteobacteria bacterium]
MTTPNNATTSFDSFPLDEKILRGVKEAGFTHCTPVQAQSLPISLANRDVAAQAQTGTGKTAAFLLATFQKLLLSKKEKSSQPRALIIAPTRELAMQIHKDATQLGKFTDLRFALAYGGTNYVLQKEAIETGCDILIGTPGRLIDFFKQKIFHLHDVEVMVLDEADRMFDLGFIKDIRFLLRRLPKPENRLGLLFSATLSFKVAELAYEHMNNPEIIRIEPEQVTAKSVEERIYYPANPEKIPLLVGLLRDLEPKRCIIFINTKRAAERIHLSLKGNDFDSGLLSGDVPQNKRERLLKSFQSGDLHLLIATDVAARGLHIPEVDLVFNFDLPQEVEDYVHRIGRTARSGASGTAISFACEEYAFSVPDIEAYIGHSIPMQSITDSLLPELKPPAKGEKRPHTGRPPRRNGGSNKAGGWKKKR